MEGPVPLNQLGSGLHGFGGKRMISMLSHLRHNACEWYKMIFWLFILMAILPLSATPVSAHKVTIFAWVDGDMVHTQSKFSGGKKAKNAVVEVYDAQGIKLLEGNTNEAGEFSFKIPQKTALKVVLVAGTGHRGEWILPIEELQGESSASSISSKHRQAEKKEIEAITKPAAGNQLSESDVKKIVEDALDRKLKPLFNMLVESKAKGPSASDIFSGIGYILGLMGLGAYIHYRRKHKE